HDGHPCLRLVVPATWPTADFHRLAIAHAGRTTLRGKPLKIPKFNIFIRLKIFLHKSAKGKPLKIPERICFANENLEIVSKAL
ncbi:hypothetical protein, partial [Petrotoga sibirica]|uniref:hypothetical protein n=1 Tax=Petrotoga sibirica TaxID=156202 RepID=UPI001AB040AF